MSEIIKIFGVEFNLCFRSFCSKNYRILKFVKILILFEILGIRL